MATIQGIYIALFGRPADPVGLAFFNEATKNGADLTAIGDLSATEEYQSRFEGMNNSEIVTAIYQALFGRDPEPEGLEFFVAQLESGAQNINTIAINILDGAQNEDALIVANKIAAAEAWTAAVAADPDALAAYQGQAGIEAGVAYLAGIGANEASIPTADELAEQLSALIDPAPSVPDTSVPSGPGSGGGSPNPPPQGQTFELIDEPGKTVNGTEGDDTFNATLDGEADGTFQAGDTIDGKGGSDTLNLSIMAWASGQGGLPLDSSVKNVEIINLIAVDATLQAGFKATFFEGALEIWQINDHVEIADVGAGVVAGFRDITSDKEIGLQVKFSEDTGFIVLEGIEYTGNMDDRISLTIEAEDNVQIHTLNVSGSIKMVGNGDFQIIDSTAPNSIRTLNISLYEDLNSELGLDFQNLETVNASGSTARLMFNISNDSIKNFVSGSGDDVITLNVVGEKDIIVDVGSGNNSVILTGGYGENASAEIILGDGRNEINILNALSNIQNVDNFMEGIISINGFNAAPFDETDVLPFDLIAIASLQALDNELIQEILDINETQSLLDAINIAVSTLTMDNRNATVFEYDNDVYIIISDNDVFSNGDGLVKISGISITDQFFIT
jgi:hypothetical protein